MLMLMLLVPQPRMYLRKVHNTERAKDAANITFATSTSNRRMRGALAMLLHVAIGWV